MNITSNGVMLLCDIKLSRANDQKNVFDRQASIKRYIYSHCSFYFWLADSLLWLCKRIHNIQWGIYRDMSRCVMHMLMNKRNAIIEFRLFLDQTIVGVYGVLLYKCQIYMNWSWINAFSQVLMVQSSPE